MTCRNNNNNNCFCIVKIISFNSKSVSVAECNRSARAARPVLCVEVGDRRKFGDQGTNLRNFWEKSNIRLRLISELMEKSKSQPSSKSPPQYWTPNHEVQKPTFNTNFAKFYKENYKSYSRKMYFMNIFLKTSIKVWLWNISDKTLLLKFGFMNTAMWSPKPNSEPNFWPKRKTETEFGAEFLTKKNNRIQPRSKFRRRPPLCLDFISLI